MQVTCKYLIGMLYVCCPHFNLSENTKPQESHLRLSQALIARVGWFKSRSWPNWHLQLELPSCVLLIVLNFGIIAIRDFLWRPGILRETRMWAMNIYQHSENLQVTLSTKESVHSNKEVWQNPKINAVRKMTRQASENATPY